MENDVAIAIVDRAQGGLYTEIDYSTTTMHLI
jgi:hypothetical protein